MKFLKKSKEPQTPPDALVVGLGNPGPQYAGTRHNVGFDVVDTLAKSNGVVLKTHKFQAQYGVGTVAGRSVVLAKPMTFMNLSGRAVAALARHFGIKPDAVLVVSDDLDMDVARVRLKPKGGAGGHNGHKSIIQALGTSDYPRLKIGIGRAGESVDHVLSRFPPDERDAVNEAIKASATACEIWLSDGIERAMNQAN